MSHQSDNKSNEISDRITNYIVENIRGMDKISMSGIKLSYIIRKVGHFVEYMVLGMLVYVVSNKIDIPKQNKILCCVLFCVLFAVADEIHQAYIPGREAKIVDVFIDMLGSVFGVMTLKLILRDKFRS